MVDGGWRMADGGWMKGQSADADDVHHRWRGQPYSRSRCGCLTANFAPQRGASGKGPWTNQHPGASAWDIKGSSRPEGP